MWAGVKPTASVRCTAYSASYAIKPLMSALGRTETFRPLLFPSPNRSTSRLTTHSWRIVSRIESDCELDTPRNRLAILEVWEVVA